MRQFVGDDRARVIEAKARADAERGDFCPPQREARTYQADLLLSAEYSTYAQAFHKRTERIKRKSEA